MTESPRATDELLGLLQDMERAAPGKPPIGKSLRAVDDVVRFGHAPHLNFAAATAEQDEKPPAPAMAIAVNMAADEAEGRRHGH